MPSVGCSIPLYVCGQFTPGVGAPRTGGRARRRGQYKDGRKIWPARWMQAISKLRRASDTKECTSGALAVEGHKLWLDRTDAALETGDIECAGRQR